MREQGSLIELLCILPFGFISPTVSRRRSPALFTEFCPIKPAALAAFVAS